MAKPNGPFMPIFFSPAKIAILKREAKSRHRTLGITHSRALDQIASENGYTNWSRLAKHNAVSSPNGAASAWVFTRSHQQVLDAMRKAPRASPLSNISRSEAARQKVDDLSKKFVSPENAIEHAIDFMQSVLLVPRFHVFHDAPIYWEMRGWLPYSCHEFTRDTYILVNRHHKPIGQISADWATYEDYPHLHLPLSTAEVNDITHPGASSGYMFDDGCPPWSARANATKYFERLKLLRSMLP